MVDYHEFDGPKIMLFVHECGTSACYQRGKKINHYVWKLRSSKIYIKNVLDGMESYIEYVN